MASEETGIPRPIADAVARFWVQVARFFPVGALRMGGGTVLQARWGHRASFDADLFCDPGVYNRAVAEQGPEMERAIGEIVAPLEEFEPFVDQLATFAQIDGIEVTILPAVAVIGTKTGRVVPHTDIETESTADILAGKLVHRMCGGGVIEPRDLFDLMTAGTRDPGALRAAVRLLSATQRAEISASLAMLHPRWATLSDKPLLSASGEEVHIDAASIRELLDNAVQHQVSRPPPRP